MAQQRTLRGSGDVCGERQADAEPTWFQSLVSRLARRAAPSSARLAREDAHATASRTLELTTRPGIRPASPRGAAIADAARRELQRVGYALIRPLGSGGFGTVWLAQNLETGHHCAIKTLRSDRQIELEGLRRYKSAVTAHEHIMPIEHVGRAADTLYCVMPLADHASETSWTPESYTPMTLARRLARQGAISAAEAARIGADLASALAHLHSCGVVHADVKPENVVCLGGRWRLTDYGLLSDLEGGQALGRTPGFSPPEGGASKEADQYALGVTLIKLTRGEQANAEQLANARCEARRGSRRLERIIRRMLSSNPAHRYLSLSVVEAVLRRVAAPPRWRAFAAAAILVLALAAAVGVALNRESTEGAPGALTQPRLATLSIPLFRMDGRQPRSVGQLGAPVQQARINDGLRVSAVFTHPVYAYLLAFDTNGAVRLCWPASDAEPPAAASTIQFPERPTAEYVLADGVGLQAFALAASSQPLPAFRAWRQSLGQPLWAKADDAIAGVWQYRDGAFLPPPASRGEVMDRGAPPTVFRQAIAALRADSRFEIIDAIAFPVLSSPESSSRR